MSRLPHKKLLPALPVLTLLFISPSLYANTGAPLLLIISIYAFALGSVFIVLIEWAVLNRFAHISSQSAIKDVLFVNLVSTGISAIFIPILVALIPVFGLAMPNESSTDINGVLEAVGTWVSSSTKYLNLTLGMTAFWLVVAFFITVWVEGKLLSARWKNRGAISAHSAMTVSITANIASYFFLAVIFKIFFTSQNK
jgi:hypothetical protein